MDIFNYDLEKINIGKIRFNESQYLEIFDLEVELPELICINGICQKINSSIKKDIFFIDLKLDSHHQEELIIKIKEIENKVVQMLENEHFQRVNYFFNFPNSNNFHLGDFFKSSLLSMDENTFYLRLKIPHDNIQFNNNIFNQENKFIEDIKFRTPLKVTINCPGIWYSNRKIGLSWNISSIIF